MFASFAAKKSRKVSIFAVFLNISAIFKENQLNSQCLYCRSENFKLIAVQPQETVKTAYFLDFSNIFLRRSRNTQILRTLRSWPREKSLKTAQKLRKRARFSQKSWKNVSIFAIFSRSESRF